MLSRRHRGAVRRVEAMDGCGDCWLEWYGERKDLLGHRYIGRSEGPIDVKTKGARYEGVSVDHRTAFGGLAGRSAATTTGPLVQAARINNSTLPNTGLICIEEMVATFCNRPVGPNNAGYGSSTAFSGSSARSGTSAGSKSSAGSGVGAASGSGISTTSIPPCGAFPSPNELCN